MPPEPSETRAIAETALRFLNTGDLDGFLAVVADDVEFTSMILEVEATTFRGRVDQLVWQAATIRDGKLTWWAFFRSEAEALDALGLR
jgi:ketosteroid isomerase-like protein